MSNEYFDKYGFPQPMDDIREYWRDWKMARITNEQLYEKLIKLEVVLLGVADSEDMGLYGEVRDTRKLVKEMNGTVRSDHAWVCALKWSVGILAMLFAGMGAGISMGFW